MTPAITAVLMLALIALACALMVVRDAFSFVRSANQALKEMLERCAELEFRSQGQRESVAGKTSEGQGR